MRASLLLVVTVASCSSLGCGSDSESGHAATDAAVDGAGEVTGSGGTSVGGGSGGKGAGGKGSGGKSSSGGTTNGNGGATTGSGGATTGNGGAKGGSGGASVADADIPADATATPHDASSRQDSGSPGAPDASAPVRRMRFVNLSPTTPPLDICQRVTGTPTFAAQPLLRARGVTTGLPYGSITDYFDLDPTKLYDFEFAESSVGACSPPIHGYLGTLQYFQVSSQTLAVYQYQFTPVPGYNGALFDDVGAPVPGRANVRYFDAAQLGPAFTDFYATPSGGTEAEWFPHVRFGGSTLFHDTGLGAHTFRVTAYNTQTLVAQKSGVTFSGNDALDVFLFSTTATAFALLRCPSTQGTLIGPCAL